MAALAPTKEPPSEKESGVTFRMPMMTGRLPIFWRKASRAALRAARINYLCSCPDSRSATSLPSTLDAHRSIVQYTAARPSCTEPESRSMRIQDVDLRKQQVARWYKQLEPTRSGPSRISVVQQVNASSRPEFHSGGQNISPFPSTAISPANRRNERPTTDAAGLL